MQSAANYCGRACKCKRLKGACARNKSSWKNSSPLVKCPSAGSRSWRWVESGACQFLPCCSATLCQACRGPGQEDTETVGCLSVLDDEGFLQAVASAVLPHLPAQTGAVSVLQIFCPEGVLIDIIGKACDQCSCTMKQINIHLTSHRLFLLGIAHKKNGSH